MKYLLTLLPFVFASCASDVKSWNASDPNDSATLAVEIMDSRAYSSDSIGLERETMTDREIGSMTRKNGSGARLHGELNVGVGAEF